RYRAQRGVSDANQAGGRDAGLERRGTVMFVFKKSIPRRPFLRGMGGTVALPLLDAMWPAMTAIAQSPAKPRTRFGAVYFPNGAIVEEWIPAEVGSGFTFKTILKPLEPFKDQLVLGSNMLLPRTCPLAGD